MRRLAVLAAILGAVLLPLSVRADEPMPSGTILSGSGETPVSPQVDYGCAGAAACRVWLESGCSPDYAGQDPALHASIVSVAHLADGAPRKLVTGRWSPLWFQFWTSDCTEVPRSRWTTWDVYCRWDFPRCSLEEAFPDLPALGPGAELTKLFTRAQRQMGPARTVTADTSSAPPELTYNV